MRDRQFDLAVVGDPRAAFGIAGQTHPTIGIDAGGVVGQRRLLRGVATDARQ